MSLRVICCVADALYGPGSTRKPKELSSVNLLPAIVYTRFCALVFLLYYQLCNYRIEVLNNQSLLMLVHVIRKKAINSAIVLII